MRLIMRERRNKGQNLIEYAVVLGIVTVALISMQTYFKRGIQLVVRVAADSYSNNTQGEVVGEVEKRIKTQMFSGTTKLDSTASLTQKIINTGESNIRTETSGSTVIKGTSRSIVGDYREKDVK